MKNLNKAIITLLLTTGLFVNSERATAQPLVDVTVQSAVFDQLNYPNFDPNGTVTGLFTVRIIKDFSTFNAGDFTVNVTLPSASPIIGTGIVVPPEFVIIEGGQANDNYVVFELSATYQGTNGPANIRDFIIPVKLVTTASAQPASATLEILNPLLYESPAGNLATSELNVQNVPLPVKLANFSARKVSETSVLNWQTTAEQNNIGFDMERSQDGKHFTKIGFEATQATNGNSTTVIDYKFVDEKPMTGINYYRLKQMDIDGKFVYSDVASVSFGNSTKQAITVYPNPAVNSVTVMAQEVSKIEVYNVIGQLVKVPVTYDANSSSINTAGLANGNYTLRVVSGTDVSNHKLVIKK